MSAIVKKAEKKRSELSAIDPKNDEMMVKEGLRLPLFVQNPEWHKKTPQEKAELSMFGKIKGYRASAPSKTRRTAKHAITVYLKNLQKDPSFKTTYFDKIYFDEILGYLQTFFGGMKNEIKVIYFNGKVVSF